MTDRQGVAGDFAGDSVGDWAQNCTESGLRLNHSAPI